eukprot:12919079-Prorocentrum_lima.AAC.1
MSEPRQRCRSDNLSHTSRQDEEARVPCYEPKLTPEGLVLVAGARTPSPRGHGDGRSPRTEVGLVQHSVGTHSIE